MKRQLSPDEAGNSQNNTASITGMVTSRDNNTPITNANVSIAQVGISALSDGTGQFALHGVPAGDWTIKASCIGFCHSSREISMSGYDRTQNFVLSTDPFEL